MLPSRNTVQLTSTGQAMENNNPDPILNQQWDEQLQLQPPLRPTNVSTSQTTSNTTNPPRSNIARETKVVNSATRRQVEVTVDEGQGPAIEYRGTHRYPAKCDKTMRQIDESSNQAVHSVIVTASSREELQNTTLPPVRKPKV